MPKIGMEPIRRRELIQAAIETIGAEGSLDVTVNQIARRAGVSSALAHHYFGGKDGLIIATMRHLLAELGNGLREDLPSASDPRQRIRTIISSNFAPSQFNGATIAAWLAFYVKAQSSPDARRLLNIYARRLHSNLAYALGKLVPRADARLIAVGAAALIDGLWIRHALRNEMADRMRAIALVENYVDAQLAMRGGTIAGPDASRASGPSRVHEAMSGEAESRLEKDGR